MAKSSAPPTSAQKRLAAERAAAARERIQSAQQRRRFVVLGTALGAIVVVVAALIIVKVAFGNGPESGVATTRVQQTVAQSVAGVPASAFDQVGAGTASGAPTATTAEAALTSGGKPRVLYVGAEFCPYCAAERWPVAVAMSRFGSFSGLGETRSSPSDVYPSTATLSFHGASYTSRYLAFTGKELQSNQVVGSSYGALDTLDPADQAIFEKDAQGYPFVDFGGKFTLNQTEYDPSVLQGKTQQQIADALSTPSSAIARGVLGAANVITARLCQLTGDQPATVCTSSGVTTAAATLTGGS